MAMQHGGRQVYSHDLMTDFALDFIETAAGHEFLLVYSIHHSARQI
jgi:hypothetical protein